MKKYIAFIAFIAACSHGPAPGTSLAGAPAPRQAVIDFLSGVKAQDLQAMSAVWGDARGPARDRLERTQLEQRLLIMQGCYDHDRYRINGERAAGAGKQSFSVSLVRGSKTKTTNFEVLRGPSSRYYLSVADADFREMMRDFCPH